MNILILSGKNESSYFVEGWYGLEQSPDGILYRAAKPQAVIHLSYHGVVELTFYVSARPEHTNETLCVDIVVDEAAQASLVMDSNNWVIRNVTLDLKEDSKIVMRCNNPWSPDQLYKNGDIRALGLLLSSIRVSTIS